MSFLLPGESLIDTSTSDGESSGGFTFMSEDPNPIGPAPKSLLLEEMVRQYRRSGGSDPDDITPEQKSEIDRRREMELNPYMRARKESLEQDMMRERELEFYRQGKSGRIPVGSDDPRPRGRVGTRIVQRLSMPIPSRRIVAEMRPRPVSPRIG